MEGNPPTRDNSPSYKQGLKNLCLVQRLSAPFVSCKVQPQGGGEWVLAVYMTGAPTELHIANPKKYISLKFHTQKNTWHQNFLSQKNTILSTLILIYSIKQTLRPKQIRDRSLDPKKYRGCKFSTQKKCENTLDLPVMYTASTPLGVERSNR